MHQNETLIHEFYTAFAQRNWKTMQTCYHDEILFTDPVFINLKGKQARAMWHMLAENARDFSLQFTRVEADEHNGSAYWEAHYTFSKTGRRVHNKIDARFQFKGGLIYHHTDTFDFWRWSRMALGATGFLLGWSSMLQQKVRANALHGLNKFIETTGY